ncbi:hypothetical protein LSH36_503g01037 [Paralvinella palmiformis]|uniref:HAUS augmin-like complex subunit 7 n=1 Tax=Paralvinella palmiformis TaxID=53620 RepID=A0AAD9MWS0_9ANNE|nr:hypothetical protein LSH36_503g01037 [Paralvinella palmiformis]
MAQSSKDKLKKYAQPLKDKLEALGCPYTEGVDESWVIDLLFKPGEHRIRLLQWLFSKQVSIELDLQFTSFDSSLENLLDPECVSVDSRMDSRIQRLLYVASSLGLCSKDDADLIRGCGSISKQLAFIEQLLDIVYIKDRSEDPQVRCMSSPGVISKGTSVKEQFYSDCHFMDSLAAQEKLELPEISKLQEAVDEIGKDLARQEEILAQLRQHMLSHVGTVRSSHKTLSLYLSEKAKSLANKMEMCTDDSTLLKDLNEYITILEDTLVRAELSYSKSTTNSIILNIVKLD